jgi:hypothetical protein
MKMSKMWIVLLVLTVCASIAVSVVQLQFRGAKSHYTDFLAILRSRRADVEARKLQNTSFLQIVAADNHSDPPPFYNVVSVQGDMIALVLVYDHTDLYSPDGILLRGQYTPKVEAVPQVDHFHTLHASSPFQIFDSKHQTNQRTPLGLFLLMPFVRLELAVCSLKYDIKVWLSSNTSCSMGDVQILKQDTWFFFDTKLARLTSERSENIVVVEAVKNISNLRGDFPEMLYCPIFVQTHNNLNGNHVQTKFVWNLQSLLNVPETQTTTHEQIMQQLQFTGLHFSTPSRGMFA